MSVEVVDLCRENEVDLICLPANATDKMQPLDVGLFRKVKELWRQMLRAVTDKDPAAKMLQKTEFPKMMKELLERLDPVDALVNGFERCGLSPVNPTKVTERIPTAATSQVRIPVFFSKVKLKNDWYRYTGKQKNLTMVFLLTGDCSEC